MTPQVYVTTPNMLNLLLGSLLVTVDIPGHSCPVPCVAYMQSLLGYSTRDQLELMNTLSQQSYTEALKTCTESSSKLLFVAVAVPTNFMGL